jgi:hypothetical protein
VNVLDIQLEPETCPPLIAAHLCKCQCIDVHGIKVSGWQSCLSNLQVKFYMFKPQVVFSQIHSYFCSLTYYGLNYFNLKWSYGLFQTHLMFMFYSRVFGDCQWFMKWEQLDYNLQWLELGLCWHGKSCKTSIRNKYQAFKTCSSVCVHAFIYTILLLVACLMKRLGMASIQYVFRRQYFFVTGLLVFFPPHKYAWIMVGNV